MMPNDTHDILTQYGVTHPTAAERCMASAIATLMLLRKADKQALAEMTKARDTWKEAYDGMLAHCTALSALGLTVEGDDHA